MPSNNSSPEQELTAVSDACYAKILADFRAGRTPTLSDKRGKTTCVVMKDGVMYEQKDNQLVKILRISDLAMKETEVSSELGRLLLNEHYRMVHSKGPLHFLRKEGQSAGNDIAYYAELDEVIPMAMAKILYTALPNARLLKMADSYMVLLVQ